MKFKIIAFIFIVSSMMPSVAYAIDPTGSTIQLYDAYSNFSRYSNNQNNPLELFANVTGAHHGLDIAFLETNETGSFVNYTMGDTVTTGTTTLTPNATY